MNDDRDNLSRLIDEWEKSDDATIGIVSGLLALGGIVLFVAFVAWLAYH